MTFSNFSHRFFYLASVVFLNCHVGYAMPDWSKSARIPETGRENIYGWDDDTWEEKTRSGRLHTLHYPVNISGILPPSRPIERLLAMPDGSPIKRAFYDAYEIDESLQSLDDLSRWLGLVDFPLPSDEGVYKVPYPGGHRPSSPMGLTRFEFDDAKVFTFSCAACHAGELFGKKVLGLTTRFPRANGFFAKSKALVKNVSPLVFKTVLGASAQETNAYKRLRENAQYIGSKQPAVYGLDTSLAHTALSLARRAPDSVASKDPYYSKNPDDEPLETFVADSKPMVWWNLKYKNRWLSDGSLVSGNPIYTNIIWNEIGRGSSLEEVENWLSDNRQTIEELTTAVFAAQAPRWEDFFDPENFDIDAAKRGELHFNTLCARCHGHYEKGWGLGAKNNASAMKNVKIRYFAQTRVIDVNTDPQRHQGMSSLARRLNPLQVMIDNGIRIEPQNGYVAPPLEGIWARWPYFHNNSIPSLCAVLDKQRPQVYFSGPANDPNTDFDQDCNGYPSGNSTPVNWRKSENQFDTRYPGLGNFGHDEGIFLDEGRELLSPAEKTDLIRFLQTL